MSTHFFDLILLCYTWFQAPVLNDNQNEHLFNVMKRLDKFAEVITFVVYTSCDFHPNILVKALPCNLNYKLSQYIF